MEFKINNVKVYGIENAARASGNPMRTEIEQEFNEEKDIKRLKNLSNTNIGEGHDQALTGIIVQFDIYAPLYMWKQLQRYHFVDFISSQSTMHRLTKFNIKESYVKDVDTKILDRYQELLDDYNKNNNEKLWRVLVASLPCGFVLGASLTTNYRQLKTIYKQRKYHKLSEWREFCSWIETLPYAKELIIRD